MPRTSANRQDAAGRQLVKEFGLCEQAAGSLAAVIAPRKRSTRAADRVAREREIARLLYAAVPNRDGLDPASGRESPRYGVSYLGDSRVSGHMSRRHSSASPLIIASLQAQQPRQGADRLRSPHRHGSPRDGTEVDAGGGLNPLRPATVPDVQGTRRVSSGPALRHEEATCYPPFAAVETGGARGTGW